MSIYGHYNWVSLGPSGPPGPTRIDTPPAFKQAVLGWHKYAGHPSIREVSTRTRTYAGGTRFARDGVPRATVGEILNPKLQRNHEFLPVWLCLRVLGVAEHDKAAWEEAHGRARTHKKTAPSASVTHKSKGTDAATDEWSVPAWLCLLIILAVIGGIVFLHWKFPLPPGVVPRFR